MAAKVGRKPKATARAKKSDPGPCEAQVGDNVKAVLEAERAQLISFMGRLGAAQANSKAAKEEYDGVRGEETKIFRLAKAAGFERQELQSYLNDMQARTKNLVEAERRRRRHRETLGLPVGDDQLDMFAKAPSEERDRMAWKADGYRAGLQNEECKAPDDIQARFVTDWTASWHDGHKSRLAAIEAALHEGAPPGDGAAASAANEADDDGFEAPPEELAQQVDRKNLEEAREAEAEAESEETAAVH